MGDKGTSTSSQKSEPWAPAQKYITGDGSTPGVLTGAADLYKKGGYTQDQDQFRNWLMGQIGKSIGYDPAKAPASTASYAPAAPVATAPLAPAATAGAATPAQQLAGLGYGGAKTTDFAPAGNSFAGSSGSSGGYPTAQWQDATLSKAASAAPVTRAAPVSAQQSGFTLDGGLTTAAAPTPVTATSAAYTPVDIASQLGKLGYDQSAITGAGSKLLSGQVDNAQLSAMQQAATNTAMRGYDDAILSAQQNILPQIGRSAVGAGQYGGTRQAMAEGLLAQQLARNARDLGIASMDAGTNLYGNAYEAAQGRMAGFAGQLQDTATQSALTGSKLGTDVSMFNAGQTNDASKINAELMARIGMFNAGQSNDMTNARNQMGLQQSMFNAGQGNQVGMFNTGQSNDLSKFDTTQASTLGMFNAGQGNDISKFNAGGALDAQKYNQQAWLGNQQVQADLQKAAAQQSLAGQQAQNDAFRNSLLSQQQQYAQSRNDYGLMQGLLAQPGESQQSALERYAKLVYGGAGLGGTATGSQTASDTSQLGSLMQTGAGAYGLYSLLSDRRFKTDITKIGETDSGLGVYTFRYKSGGPMQMGVMAQEVEGVFPEAVQDVDGIKMVDYSKVK